MRELIILLLGIGMGICGTRAFDSWRDLIREIGSPRKPAKGEKR